MGYFKRILNNCSDTSLLALKRKEENISFRQKLEMKVHIYFCKCCQNFEKQSAQIDEALKTYFRNIDNRPPVKASEEFKARMKAQIK